MKGHLRDPEELAAAPLLLTPEHPPRDRTEIHILGCLGPETVAKEVPRVFASAIAEGAASGPARCAAMLESPPAVHVPLAAAAASTERHP